MFLYFIFYILYFTFLYFIVILTGVWPYRPTLSGGPLGEVEYEFYSMVFHWGPCDAEGSEHTLDGARFAMELQMIHVRKGFLRPLDVVDSGIKEGIVIISYFFQVNNLSIY